MLTPDQFLGFLAAAIAITASPGPDNLMVLSLGISQGRRRGVAFGLGCAFGCLSHTVLAVVGVSALIAASPLAFGALRVAGGLYLVWLGVRAIRGARQTRIAGVETLPNEAVAKSARDLAQPGTNSAHADGGESLQTLFLRGMVANAINPKVVLFFLSFLPQFVVPAQGGVAMQMALLGITFTLQAAVLFGLLGYFSGTVGAWLNRRPRVGLWMDRVAGAVFIGLGVRLIVAR